MLGRALAAATGSPAGACNAQGPCRLYRTQRLKSAPGAAGGPLAAAALPLLSHPSSGWSAAWQATTAAAAPWPSQQLRGLAARAIAAAPAAAPRESPDPYTTAPRNYIQLLQHIQRARDLDRLEALLRSYGPRFDAVHVAAAMVAVPKLMAVVHPDGLKVAAAVAKQRNRQPAYLMAELQRAALGCLHRLAPREVAHMAWATAATHKLLPRSARSEARAKWERQERQERKRDTCAAAEAQPQAEAGAKVDAGMQQQQQHQHQDQVWEVPASLRQQRVYTLHFTSRLLQQLRRAHKARGEWALSGADASQLMYALGRLKYRAPAGQRAWLVKQVVKTAGQQGLTAKQAALVLWGMGRLGWRKPAAVAALRGVLVRERLYLRPAYAAAALAGLARLGWKDGAIIEAACKVFEEQMYSARTQDLALLVNTTSRLGVPLAAPLAAALQARALDTLERFTPQQLSLIMDGLARQGQLGGQLARAVVEGIAAEEAVAMSPGDATRFLSSWAACSDLDLDHPTTQRAATLVGHCLLTHLVGGGVTPTTTTSSSSKGGDLSLTSSGRRVLLGVPSKGGLSGAAAADLAHALCMFGLELESETSDTTHKLVVKALAASLAAALVTPRGKPREGSAAKDSPATKDSHVPTTLAAGGRSPLAARSSPQLTLQQLASLVDSFATMEQLTRELSDAANSAMLQWLEVAVKQPAEKVEAAGERKEEGQGEKQDGTSSSSSKRASNPRDTQAGALWLPQPPTAAAEGGNPRQQQRQGRRYQQQVAAFRRNAHAAVEVVGALSAAGKLNTAVASQVCAAVAPHLGVMKPRSGAMLLWAVARHQDAATSEGGRALLATSALPWVQQQLLGEGGGEPASVTCLANAAAAIAVAGKHGLLVESGPPVLQQLYQALVPRVTGGRVTQLEAARLVAALEAVPCEELAAALALGQQDSRQATAWGDHAPAVEGEIEEISLL